MKKSEILNNFKNLNESQIQEKITELSKELFDLRFKQATRQLSETHKFKTIKKTIAQLLTFSNSKSNSQKLTD